MADVYVTEFKMRVGNEEDMAYACPPLRSQRVKLRGQTVVQTQPFLPGTGYIRVATEAHCVFSVGFTPDPVANPCFLPKHDTYQSHVEPGMILAVKKP